MTGFDIAVLVVIVLSTLLAFVRGVVRELLALAAWIVGLLAALRFSDPVALLFAGLEIAPAAKQVFAFALILVAVLLAGAIVAWMLVGMVRAVGLGFLDRFLGALFGLARGVLFVLALVLVAGLTTLPRRDWWQNAALGPTFVAAALALRPWLPQAWAERLDYSAAGKVSASRGADGLAGARRRT